MGLSQLVFGQGLMAGRIAAALAVFVGGIILYFWLRREIGWIGAVAAAGFWLVLPRGTTTGPRLDRYALLEPFMVLFAIAAFAAVWQWYRGRSWMWLAISAVAMALSVTSKVSSAVVVPAVLLIVVMGKRWHTGLVAALGFCALLAAVAVLVYLPVGLVGAVEYMLAYQSMHDAQGHLITVAGVATLYPPWWANLLFSVEGLGIGTAVVLAAGSVASVWSRRWALLALVGSSIGLLWIFYLLISKVALNHYYYAWVWLFAILAGVGVAVLLAHKRSRLLTDLTRIGDVVLIALAVVCGAVTSIEIWQERPAGMALVTQKLDDLGIDRGDVFVGGMAEWEYTYLLDGRQTTDPTDPDIVAYALKDEVRFPVDPALLRQLDDQSGQLDEFVFDDVTLYVVESAER